MNAVDASVVAGLLAEELAALRRFRALLSREQDILKANEADALPALSTDKQSVAEELAVLLRRREQALAGAGFESGRSGMLAWLARQSPTVRVPADAQWQELLALLAECRTEHEINGKLIAMQLARTQQALSALMIAGGKPLTYGPDGQQHIGLGTGRTLGSA